MVLRRCWQIVARYNDCVYAGERAERMRLLLEDELRRVDGLLEGVRIVILRP